MEFFKNLSAILVDGQQITVTLRKEGQDLVASIMPSLSGVKDKAVESIVPIVINGTPEDFDNGFLDAVVQGIPQATGLVSNIKDYEESVETARKNTEMAKKAKDEKEKAKKEFNGWIALARQNTVEQKFVDAKKCLAKAAAVKDADKALIEKAYKAIDERSGVGSIFGGPTDKSDGKNITLGKDFKVPAPEVKETKPSDAVSSAFERAMDLSDDNDIENENDMEE